MNKKYYKVIIVIMMIIIGSSTKIYSMGEYNIAITPSKQNLMEGEEITITFEINDITAQPGIGAIYGELEYDKKIFEKITQEDFIQSSGWELPIYNDATEAEGALFLLRENGDLIKENSTLFTVKLKVQDKVQACNTKIILKNISSSTAEEDIEIADVEIDLSVEGTLNPTIEVIKWGGIILALIILTAIILIKIKKSKNKAK